MSGRGVSSFGVGNEACTATQASGDRQLNGDTAYRRRTHLAGCVVRRAVAGSGDALAARTALRNHCPALLSFFVVAQRNVTSPLRDRHPWNEELISGQQPPRRGHAHAPLAWG